MVAQALPLLTAAGSLAAVLTVILGGQFLLRRTRLAPGHNPGRQLAVVESLAVDPRRRLLLVACRGRHVLLLVGGTADLQLTAWTDPKRDAGSELQLDTGPELQHDAQNEPRLHARNEPPP